MNHRIHLTVNGEIYDINTPSHYTLLRVLREQLVLTGVKNGCEAGECGACAVLLNGEPVNSCMVLAAEAKKRREAAVAFEDGARPESAAKERAEAAVIQDYLPEQLGPEEIARVREIYGWNAAPFEIPAEIRAAWLASGTRGATARAAWEGRVAALSNTRRAEFERVQSGALPARFWRQCGGRHG